MFLFCSGYAEINHEDAMDTTKWKPMINPMKTRRHHNTDGRVQIKRGMTQLFAEYLHRKYVLDRTKNV